MPSNPQKPTYWFPAKKYGWGWGPPTCWQGWAVMLIWLAILMTTGFLLAPQSIPLFILATIILSAALTFICYLKGEPPRWRWGKD